MHRYKKCRNLSFLEGEGSMAESCGWLFVYNVPLLYDKRRVARQLQVENWLDLAQVVKELKIEDLIMSKRSAQPPADYIV
jgi:hypothetical protein